MNDVVRRYEPTVRRIAASIKWKIPTAIDHDDLMQVGLLAAVRAAPRHDPDSGASELTYVSIRIRGAMLDEIRSMSWEPRLVRREASLARAEEIAIENTTMRSVSRVGEEPINSEVAMDQAKSEEDTPDVAAETAEIVARIMRTLAGMPARTLDVLDGQFGAEYETLKSIGSRYGFSEARASQITRAAAASVRAAIVGEPA